MDYVFFLIPFNFLINNYSNSFKQLLNKLFNS